MLPFGIIDNGLPPEAVVVTSEFDKYMMEWVKTKNYKYLKQN
jgi:hypothetical protein